MNFCLLRPAIERGRNLCRRDVCFRPLQSVASGGIVVVVFVTVKKCTTKLDARAELLFDSFDIKPLFFAAFVASRSLITK